MELVIDRAPQYPGRVTITPVSGNTYTITRADQPTQPGTQIDAGLFNSYLGFDNLNTTFGSDGSITQTDPNTGATLKTTFNSDGSITETLSQNGRSITKRTSFGSNGNIQEVTTG